MAGGHVAGGDVGQVDRTRHDAATLETGDTVLAVDGVRPQARAVGRGAWGVGRGAVLVGHRHGVCSAHVAGPWPGVAECIS